MKQCKCEHWQDCPVCQPSRFDADGNRLPPEPTPLQAARAQIEKDTALLRQALYVIEAWERGCDKSDYWRDRDDAIAALRERLNKKEKA